MRLRIRAEETLPVTDITFSVLHATLGRPEKAIAAMLLFHDRAQHPEKVEYILSVNSDDDTRFPLDMHLLAHAPRLKFARYHTVASDALGSAAAWNAAAQVCSGKLLVQASDDIEPADKWDAMLMDVISGNERLQKEGKPFCIAVSDGYRKDALCVTAICSRDYMAMEGYFLNPQFLSVWSDDHWTYRALRNERDGKSYFIQARQIVFLHQHHYHTKTVPWDNTYAKQNSAVAYRVGEKLFRELNPRAATDGLKTW